MTGSGKGANLGALNSVLQHVLERGWDIFDAFWLATVVFCGIAVLTKRYAVFSAMKAVLPELKTNIGLLIANSIVFAPLFIISGDYVHGLVNSPAPLIEFWANQAGIVQLISALLLIEFCAYWRHRLLHTIVLWPAHATHHSDETLHWFSAIRKHPFERLITVLIDGSFAILIGLPLGAIALAGLARTWWGFFIHSDVDWTLGPIGVIMISPPAHRLHHIRDERLMGSNFGNTITLWDRIFGTYVDPSPYLKCETGIAEGSRSVWGELARPFERQYWSHSRLNPYSGPEVG